MACRVTGLGTLDTGSLEGRTVPVEVPSNAIRSFVAKDGRSVATTANLGMSFGADRERGLDRVGLRSARRAGPSVQVDPHRA